MSILDRALRVGEGKKFKEFERNVELINAFEPELELESDDELRERYEGLRERYLDGESLDALLYESFALTREAGKRALGQRHFDVQLIGGMVLNDGSIAEMKTGEAGRRPRGRPPFDVQLIGGMVLNDAPIAEMKPGEGKPLPAPLPVVLNALASRDEDGTPAKGAGVHLVTVNDYLARRDAMWMK